MCQYFGLLISYLKKAKVCSCVRRKLKKTLLASRTNNNDPLPKRELQEKKQVAVLFRNSII